MKYNRFGRMARMSYDSPLVLPNSVENHFASIVVHSARPHQKAGWYD
jgi:hypothetical protein